MSGRLAVNDTAGLARTILILFEAKLALNVTSGPSSPLQTEVGGPIAAEYREYFQRFTKAHLERAASQRYIISIYGNYEINTTLRD